MKIFNGITIQMKPTGFTKMGKSILNPHQNLQMKKMTVTSKLNQKLKTKEDLEEKEKSNSILQEIGKDMISKLLNWYIEKSNNFCKATRLAWNIPPDSF